MERNPRQPTDTKEHIQHSAKNKTDTDERRCTSPSKDEPSWSTPRTNPTRRNAKESPHHNEAHDAHASTTSRPITDTTGLTIDTTLHNGTGNKTNKQRRRRNNNNTHDEPTEAKDAERDGARGHDDRPRAEAGRCTL